MLAGDVSPAVWIFRACVIEGSQQIYVAVLWFWVSRLSGFPQEQSQHSSVPYPSVFVKMAVPIAIWMWIIGLSAYLGLPDCYREDPRQISSSFKFLFKGRIHLVSTKSVVGSAITTLTRTFQWFCVFVMVQNYFLAASYGSNWTYLWSSQHAPTWAVIILILILFLGIWTASLYLLGSLSTSHPWIFPIFAIGLGASRWAQILWSTSGIGSWIPWIGSSPSPIAGALAGRALWLWLGVLDAIQGVGFAIILMKTMTRLQITATMASSQVLGSVATMLARVSMPDTTSGPSPLFPNFAIEGMRGLGNGWFWACLLVQLGVYVGLFTLYRREQIFS